jgi:integrase
MDKKTTTDSGLTPSVKAVIKFCEASPEGKYMLEKVAKSQSTRYSYSLGCKFFSDFLGKGLTEIVNEYRADVQANMYNAFDKWEQLFDKFAIHLEKNLNYSSGSVSLYFAGAKALINTNVPRSMRLQTKSPTVISRTIPGVTIDDLKEIYGMCDVRERAFITILKDSGLSAMESLTVNVGTLEGFDKGEQYCHIVMFRGKEGVEYETFIGPNATDALRAYLNLRKQRGEQITPETPIFASDKKPYGKINLKTLKTMFSRISERTGKTISTHRLRKFFETYMALTVRHPIVLKYWMGHKIRGGRDVEARYIIPPTPEQKQLYVESYKNIDLNPKPESDELMKAEIKTRLDGMSVEQRKRYVAELTVMYAERARRILSDPNVKKLIDKPDTNPDGAGFGDQYEQIDEARLLDYLKAGWTVAHKLANGEVIVKR